MRKRMLLILKFLDEAAECKLVAPHRPIASNLLSNGRPRWACAACDQVSTGRDMVLSLCPSSTSSSSRSSSKSDLPKRRRLWQRINKQVSKQLRDERARTLHYQQEVMEESTP